MGLIGTVIVGLIVSLVARFLRPDDDSVGWIVTILFDIGGPLLAIYGDQTISFYQTGQAAGFIDTVTGVAVLLVVYGLIERN